MKDIKENENVNANANENASANEKDIVKESDCKLYVERSKFKAKDGREMWTYAVNGNVRGRDTKVDFQAFDQGGYEVLDMIFDINERAELIMHDENVTNSETGEIRSFTVYEVQNVDEDGDSLSCRVKPARDSDKSILLYLLKKLKRNNSDSQ